VGQDRLRDTQSELIFRTAVLSLRNPGVLAPFDEALLTSRKPSTIFAIRENLVPVLWPFAVRHIAPPRRLIETIVFAIESVPSRDTPEHKAADIVAAQLLGSVGIHGIEARPYRERSSIPDSLKDQADFLFRRSRLAHLKTSPPEWRIEAITVARAASLELLHGERLRAARILHWLKHPYFSSPRQAWITSFMADILNYFELPRSANWWQLQFEIQLLTAPRRW